MSHDRFNERNISKEIKESTVIMCDLNLLDWIFLKLDKSMTNNLYKPLAKNCDIKDIEYWKRLDNMDIDGRFFYPSIFNSNRVRKEE